jgi:hypothetical protein
VNDELDPVLAGEEIIPDNTSPTTDTVQPDAVDPPYEVTTGLDVPAQAIEAGTVNLSVNTARIHNFAISEFLAVPNSDTSELGDVKRELLAQLTIDNEVDTVLTRIEKQLNLFFLMGIGDNIAKVYGTPVEHFQSTTKFKPQATIIFKELTINDQDLPLRNYYLEKELSIRLLTQNIPNSEEQLEELRVKIVDIFGGFIYTSSKTLTHTYRDKQDGLYFAVSAERDVSRVIIEKALSIQEIEYDDDLLVATTFPVGRQKKVNALGKEVDEPNRGKWGEVRFNRIEYKQGGILDRILRP